MTPTLARVRRLRLPDHHVDLDAYAEALRALVDATDHHARGPLRRELARALAEARELLGEDRR